LLPHTIQDRKSSQKGTMLEPRASCTLSACLRVTVLASLYAFADRQQVEAHAIPAFFFMNNQCAFTQRVSFSDLLQFQSSNISALPRHSLLQYMGSGLWNSAGINAEMLISAMLGNASSVVPSVGFQVIRWYLQGYSGLQVAQMVNDSWQSSPPDWLKYVALGRQHFLRMVAMLNISWVKNSPAYLKLPSHMRDEIQMLKFRLNVHDATCVAKLLLDLSFSLRSTEALANHINEYMHPLDDSMFAILNFQDFSVTDIVYTTTYQPLANSWYGGSLTVVFSSGSGIDRFWARAQIDRMNRTGWNCIVFREHDTCKHMPYSGVLHGDRHENSRYADDAGEIRTPGYKNADDVEGFLYFGDSVQRVRRGANDEPVIARRPPVPVLWAFMRWSCCGHDSFIVSILAPCICRVAVFGIARGSCDRCAPRYLASSRHIGPDVIDSDDLHVASVPPALNISIPLWGLLYRKSGTASNGISFCSACKLLRSLVLDADHDVLLALRNARLPESLHRPSTESNLVSVRMLYGRDAEQCGCALR